ncbi:hypothetical protein BC830DRAFT_1094242 [Chytriomyces sp. MP71]|nr:hypothetical protein BC830DRAFT_1094242 [Chytriomyces sp. MP71]
MSTAATAHDVLDMYYFDTDPSDNLTLELSALRLKIPDLSVSELHTKALLSTDPQNEAPPSPVRSIVTTENPPTASPSPHPPASFLPANVLSLQIDTTPLTFSPTPPIPPPRTRRTTKSLPRHHQRSNSPSGLQTAAFPAPTDPLPAPPQQTSPTTVTTAATTNISPTPTPTPKEPTNAQLLDNAFASAKPTLHLPTFDDPHQRAGRAPVRPTADTDIPTAPRSSSRMSLSRAGPRRSKSTDRVKDAFGSLLRGKSRSRGEGSPRAMSGAVSVSPAPGLESPASPISGTSPGVPTSPVAPVSPLFSEAPVKSILRKTTVRNETADSAPLSSVVERRVTEEGLFGGAFKTLSLKRRGGKGEEAAGEDGEELLEVGGGSFPSLSRKNSLGATLQRGLTIQRGQSIKSMQAELAALQAGHDLEAAKAIAEQERQKQANKWYLNTGLK